MNSAISAPPPSTLHPPPSTLNPQHEPPRPNPEIPKLKTYSPKPQPTARNQVAGRFAEEVKEQLKKTGVLFPSKQRQRRTSRTLKDMLPLRMHASECVPWRRSTLVAPSKQVCVGRASLANK